MIHPDVWEGYYQSFSTERRNFYSRYVKKHQLSTIFEFGCSSGPNLQNIKDNVPYPTFCYGYDISSEAVKLARKRFGSDTCFFTDELDKNKMKDLLNYWDVKRFDFSIYDRVLYLLSESKVQEHFNGYKNLFKIVVIDDFHNSDFVDTNDAYHSKDYEKILREIGFELIDIKNSEHISGDDFFERSAKRLIFVNRDFGL